MLSRQSTAAITKDSILLRGYQKKLKTMKKKYFVLYEESASNCARLEYFDNEKKFKSGSAPKRVIKLKNCFNINRRLDTKHEYVIALSTKDGGFGIVLDSEEEMLKWLEVLIKLQRIDDTSSEQRRPHFEHVWQVVVQRRGLAEEKGVYGNYHACLTPKSLTFIRINSEKASENRIQSIEFLLTTIRRCGDSQCFFYMEVGRHSVIGPGELWMETEDALIAQNMHNMILSAMSSKNDTHIDPMRKRSSSANEASKPISMLLRKQIQVDSKPSLSPSGLLYGRERCDSLPSARNRNTNDSSKQGLNSSSMSSSRNISSHGFRSQLVHRHSNSPPTSSSISCTESECSVNVDGQEDNNGHLIPYRFHSRSSDGVIPEENGEDMSTNESKSYDGVDGPELPNESSHGSVNAVNQFRKPNAFFTDLIHIPMHIRTVCTEYSNRSPKFAENTEQRYILMEPTRSDIEKVKQSRKDNDDFEPLRPMCLQSHDGAAHNNIKFVEYTSDNMNASVVNPNAATFTTERPKRANSIGSCLEHNKLKMRTCPTSSMDADVNTARVRAFSVGSRAKVPHCDIRGGLLNSKLDHERTVAANGSSSNIKNLSHCQSHLNFGTARDKKSTSAPILIHKSQNSVDRMGDLMEIDFSKSPQSCDRTPPVKLFSRFLGPHDANNETTLHKALNGNNCCSLAMQKSTASDSVYLEMKPVSSCLSTTLNVMSGHAICKNMNNNKIISTTTSTTATTTATTTTSTSTSTEYLPMYPTNFSSSWHSDKVCSNSNEINDNIDISDNGIGYENNGTVGHGRRGSATTGTSPGTGTDNDQGIDIVPLKRFNAAIKSADKSPARSKTAFNDDHNEQQQQQQDNGSFGSPLDNKNDNKLSISNNLICSSYLRDRNYDNNNKHLDDEDIDDDDDNDDDDDDECTDATTSQAMDATATTNAQQQFNADECGRNDPLPAKKDVKNNSTNNSTSNSNMNINNINNSNSRYSDHKTSDNCRMIENYANVIALNRSSKDISTEKGERNRTSPPLDSDFGYQILQIKSDSSLPSNKLYQRSNSARQEKQSPHVALNNRPNSANSVCLPLMASALLHKCSSSGSPAMGAVENKTVTCLMERPLSISDSLQNFDNVAFESIATTTKSHSQHQPSRPPSVSSERELYYASLDLPQCLSENTNVDDLVTKNGNPDESTSLCCASKVKGSEPSFSYAKIYFDHRDPSYNLTSKICNSS